MKQFFSSISSFLSLFFFLSLSSPYLLSRSALPFFSSNLAPISASLGHGRPPPVRPSSADAKSDQKQPRTAQSLSTQRARKLLAHPPSHGWSFLYWLAPPSALGKPQPAQSTTSVPRPRLNRAHPSTRRDPDASPDRLVYDQPSQPRLTSKQLT